MNHKQSKLSHRNVLGVSSLIFSLRLSLRSGRQPTAVHPVPTAATGGRGEAAQDVPPGAAASGRVAGRTSGAGAGGFGSALRFGQ